MKSVLFVCLGNICRSPTAEGVFRKTVADSDYGADITIDSAGTGNWHIGHAPDSRAIFAASARGIDISGLKARQVQADDLINFNYVIAMDRQNHRDLIRLADKQNAAKVHLFMHYSNHYDDDEVPDPYYGGEQGFDRVLDMIEDASQGLLTAILESHA